MASSSAVYATRRIPNCRPWRDDWRTSRSKPYCSLHTRTSLLAIVVVVSRCIPQAMCVVCSDNRGSISRKASLQTPIVGDVWERVPTDITGPHPRSSVSNRFILTLVDHFLSGQKLSHFGITQLQ